MSIRTLKKGITKYFTENAAILASGTAALSGDANANRVYCLLKKHLCK